ncbi:MAG: NAD+ synthase [Deltaproteobacteria bacterium]|nr:NAD+ synthase [Deltaproteobacteria bacterium]
MKIALGQINSTVGDIEGNLKKILQAVQKAGGAGADLAVFHEMTLLGYPPRDLLELPHVIEKNRAAVEKVASAAVGIAVLVGLVEKNPEKTGKPLFNSAAWCEEGKIKKVFHKSLLPSYDVFDETRYFEPGPVRDTIDYRGRIWGVSICEDIWNDPAFWGRRLYPEDPIAELVGKGSEILVNISASPYSIGKFNVRRDMISALARRHHLPVVYVNQVGGNDELIFDGGSMVVGPEGNLLALAPFFKEGVTFVELDNSKKGIFNQPHSGAEGGQAGKLMPEGMRQTARQFDDLPMEGPPNNAAGPPSSLAEATRAPLNDMALLEEALVFGLRDYVRKCGFKKVALGLSGGIDSALTACLAVKAVGPANVLGLIMPSRYSSNHSLADAERLAKNLKMRTREIRINPLHSAYEKSFRKMFGRRKADATEENIQARIRGNLLMAVSNKLGHLVLSTGNKSELAVGYCTLYGDMSGGLAVISDLPKTMVYKLSRYINRKKEIIPQNCLTKPPSAELKPNQTDQDSLPPYEILDGILKAYVEDLRSEEEIIKMGYEKGAVQKVIRMIDRNEYKRRQAAPGLRVTSRAFGMGRRFPIAQAPTTPPPGLKSPPSEALRNRHPS